MKVLAIAADIDPQRIGGAEAHFIEVLKRIAPKLEKVTVLVGSNTGIKNIFIKNDNIEIVKIDYPKILGFSWIFYIIYTLPHVLKHDYDLIWIKQEYLVWAGFLSKILSGKPLYVTCQNPNLATEEWVAQTGFTKFLQNNFGKIGTQFLMFPLRFANSVAAVSSYSANLAKKYGAKRIVIIPNGVTC